MILDPFGSSETRLRSRWYWQTFVARYRPDGELAGVEVVAQGNHLRITPSVAAAPNGTCLVTGEFRRRLDLWPRSYSPHTLRAGDRQDAFLLRCRIGDLAR